MPRPRHPLEPQYGRLTVLKELSGSKVEVRCQCGTVKTVNRSNLRSGRVVSCGSDTCREVPKAGPRARGPTWVPRHAIAEVYNNYITGAVSVGDMAEHYGVHEQTVYALMRRIDQLGGLAAYLEYLKHPAGAVTLVPGSALKAEPAVVVARLDAAASPAGVPPPPPRKWG